MMVAPAGGLSRSLAPFPSLRSVTARPSGAMLRLGPIGGRELPFGDRADESAGVRGVAVALGWASAMDDRGFYPGRWSLRTGELAMRDVELYRRLLGIEAPWEVVQVELSVREQRVDVVVGHAKGVRWRCPECAAELSCFDHAEQRAWRHLDSCGFLTWLHARPPRVCCPAHGVR